MFFSPNMRQLEYGNRPGGFNKVTFMGIWSATAADYKAQKDGRSQRECHWKDLSGQVGQVKERSIRPTLISLRKQWDCKNLGECQVAGLKQARAAGTINLCFKSVSFPAKKFPQSPRKNLQ